MILDKVEKPCDKSRPPTVSTLAHKSVTPPHNSVTPPHNSVTPQPQNSVITPHKSVTPQPQNSVITPHKSVTPQPQNSVITPHKSVERECVDLIGDVTAWPSLSESTTTLFSKSPSPSPQAPAVTDSPPNPSAKPTPSPNPNPNRPKFSGRGGSSRAGPSHGGYIRHPPPPPFYGFEQGPIRGPFFYGPQPRGHHYNHRPIRPAFHPTDVPFPQPGPMMSYPISPHPMVPFPFITPMLPPEPFIGMPHYTAAHGPLPPPSLSPPLANHLETKLLNQINYYFSDENLVKDMYLRSQMDEGGWVPIALIANFNKVRELTQDIHLILESLGTSAVVEVQGSKIRRRNDWRRWIPTATTSPQETATGLNTIRTVAV